MNIYEIRAKALHDVRDLYARAEAEGRSLDVTELEQVRKLNTDVESYDEQIALRSANIAALDAETERRSRVPETAATESRGTQADPIAAEYRSYLRTGVLPVEARAQLAGNNTLGGFLVPDTYGGLVESIRDTGLALRVFNVLNTPDGTPIKLSTYDGTSIVPGFVAEGATTANAANLTFGSVTLGAHTAVAGPYPVSLDLMADSAIEDHIRSFFVDQFAANFDTYALTGNGTSQPVGVFNAASASNTASNTAITAAELIDFATTAVNSAYQPTAGWIMHPSTFAKVRNLTANGSGQFVYSASLKDGEPDRLLGKPVYVSSYAPAFAAGAKAIAYGDFKRHLTLRVVSGTSVIRLNEAFALQGMVGFVGRRRWDAQVTDAKAVKILGIKA